MMLSWYMFLLLVERRHWRTITLIGNVHGVNN